MNGAAMNSTATLDGRITAAPQSAGRSPVAGLGHLVRRLAIVAAAVGLTACAAVPPRYVQNNHDLANRSLAVRIGSTPSFYADTPERRMFGPFGAVAALRSGNQLIESLAIADPAHDLSGALAQDLQKANRMASTADTNQADVVLDVKTTNWDFRPYRNDPGQLFVVYAARVTLTERTTGRVLIQDRCRSGRDPSEAKVNAEQLLADGGRLLREELAEATRICLAQLSAGPLRFALTPGLPPVASHDFAGQARASTQTR